MVSPSAAQQPGGAPANPNAPATITVANTVIRPRNKVMPLGANNFGGMGPVDFVANNFVNNPHNEPMSVRHLYRVAKSFGSSAELDRGGVGKYQLYGSGYLSGAYARIYRLVDKDGKSLPQTGNNPNDTYIDVDKAASVKLVRTSRVIPEGAPGFPSGGWVSSKYTNVKGLRAAAQQPQPHRFLFSSRAALTFTSSRRLTPTATKASIRTKSRPSPVLQQQRAAHRGDEQLRSDDSKGC
jgi:hypothetical protein